MRILKAIGILATGPVVGALIGILVAVLYLTITGHNDGNPGNGILGILFAVIGMMVCTCFSLVLAVNTIWPPKANPRDEQNQGLINDKIKTYSFGGMFGSAFLIA